MLADRARQRSDGDRGGGGLQVAWEQVWEIEPIPFDDRLIELADEVVAEVAGRSHRLPSGPLHDAAEMARVLPR